MLGVARNATAGSTYHYPAGGELPAVSSRPTATGTHSSEQRRSRQLPLVATQRRRPAPGVGSARLEARAASSSFPDYIPHNAARRDRLVSEVGEGPGRAGRRSGSGLRGTRRVEYPRAGNHLVRDSQSWRFSIPTWRLLRERRTQLTPANRLSLRAPAREPVGGGDSDKKPTELIESGRQPC
ncbi:coiled-coil domain-containing protein 126 isoform X1 [Mirounga angustirostris]|uniref:coiled-coil domain-containing protein 126 isoform X1 n=1 Tax=Mirounga angustirostris TaxID=9716 RepID=UPI00313E172A